MEDKKHPETFTLYQIVVQLHGKNPDEDITSQKERSLLDNLIPVVSSYPFCHLRVWYKSISNEEVEGLGRMIKEFYDENISFQELYRDEKVSYQNKAFNIAKAVVVGRDDWLAFLTYDPPERRQGKEYIEKEMQSFMEEFGHVGIAGEWVSELKGFIKRHEDASTFLNKIRELYKKNPFWDEKGLETVKGKKRISKYENEKAQVVKAGKKLIAANPKWRISNIVNKRNGYIHESIKATLRNSGLDETEWPPLSTLATWIGPHVTNKRPGR